MKGYELETERSSLNNRSAFLLGRAAQQWERRGGEVQNSLGCQTSCRLFSRDNFFGFCPISLLLFPNMLGIYPPLCESYFL